VVFRLGIRSTLVDVGGRDVVEPHKWLTALRMKRGAAGQPLPTLDDHVHEDWFELDQTGANARYGGHPPRAPEDFFWTAAWMIPKDFPTGTFGYKVTVTDMEGNTQTWEPIKETRGWVVILPQIAEYTKADAPPAPAGIPTR
jgi:hypothetical protein